MRNDYVTNNNLDRANAFVISFENFNEENGRKIAEYFRGW